MSTSPRNTLTVAPQKPDRPRRATAVGRPRRVTAVGRLSLAAAIVVLLMAAAVAVYLAVHFFAVARGSSFAPFTTGTHGDRLVVMLAALVLLVGLLAVLLRRAGRPVWLTAEQGGVLVAPGTIAEPLQRELAFNAEVVGAHVHVSSRGGRLRADAQVAVRPLADAKRLRAEFSATVSALLGRITGVEPDRVNVNVRVLNVRQLGRHL